MGYELHHKNNAISPILESGRHRYKFTPETPYDELKLVHGGQIGDWYFDQVMLNRGQFEQYAENTNTESMLGATFRHINELQTYVTDENGDMTRMVREGMRSSYRIFQDIQEGTSSETLDSDNGLYRIIKDTQTNSMSEFIQTSDLFASRIGEIIEDDLSIGTQISQTKDMIELAFFGSNDDQISRLVVGEGNIFINDSLFHLGGGATFNEVFARNVWAEGVTADNVTAMTATFGHAIINNLDVNSATVNKASFIEALFNGVRSRVRIHSGGMDVMRSNGTYSSRFHDNGIDIYRDADWVGSVRSLNAAETTGYYAGKKSMSLSTRPNAYLSLSYWSAQDDTYYRALGLGGDGRLRLHSSIYAGNTDYGLSIVRSNISGRPALKLHASNGGGGIYIEPNREVWISLTNGYFQSFQKFYDDFISLKQRVASMDGGSSSGGGGSSPTITYHTTTAGQYPYLIAEMYGITLGQLYAWNTWYTPGSVVNVDDRWRVS